ncbi:MAG: RDD family protein [Reyranellaceae bacterium]
MAGSDLPVPFTLRLDSAGATPDPISEPQYYEGLLTRRVVAYFLDLFLIVALWMGAFVLGVLVKIVTFGLLAPLVALGLAVLAPAYHVLTVSSPGRATLGMRAMGLEVRTFDGGRPSWLHALVQIVLFYFTVSLTGGLVLLAVLFNRHRRTLHDILSHLVVLRRLPAGTVTAMAPPR